MMGIFDLYIDGNLVPTKDMKNYRIMFGDRAEPILSRNGQTVLRDWHVIAYCRITHQTKEQREKLALTGTSG